MSNDTETNNTPTPPATPITGETTDATTTEPTPTPLIGDSDETPNTPADDITPAGEPHAFEAQVEAEALSESLPEGLTLTDEQSTEFLDIINGAESRADLATKMLTMYNEVAQAASTAGVDSWNALQQTWRDEMTADKDLGGEALNENLGRVNTIVKQYGGKEFTEALQLTGLGNNLHLLRFLDAVSKDLPQPATPATGKPAAGDTRLADRLFGTPAST